MSVKVFCKAFAVALATLMSFIRIMMYGADRSAAAFAVLPEIAVTAVLKAPAICLMLASTTV